MLAWYGVAKVCELLDHEIYAALGVVSGHSLKHLAVGVACLALLRHWRRRAGRRVSKLLVSACLLGDPVRYDGRSGQYIQRAGESLAPSHGDCFARETAAQCAPSNDVAGGDA